MTPHDALKKLQNFTVEHIAAHILLQKEYEITGNVMDNAEQEVEYVHPFVEIGTIPHKNFQPLAFQTPMILWTIDEVQDDGANDEGRILNIRAYVSTYGGDIYKAKNGEATKLPDDKAYLDLLNLLEFMYIKFSSVMNIDGLGIHKPFTYGFYDGAFYPYAYGYFTLQAEILPVQYNEYADIEKFL